MLPHLFRTGLTSEALLIFTITGNQYRPPYMNGNSIQLNFIEIASVTIYVQPHWNINVANNWSQV